VTIDNAAAPVNPLIRMLGRIALILFPIPVKSIRNRIIATVRVRRSEIGIKKGYISQGSDIRELFSEIVPFNAIACDKLTSPDKRETRANGPIDWNGLIPKMKCANADKTVEYKPNTGGSIAKRA
jgi:hypothetical protein